MNRIYRSLWNARTQTFVAVSELASSAGKRSLPGSGGGLSARGFVLTILAASLMLAGAPAMAGPTGAVVTAGQVAIGGAPGAMTITQGSDKAAINWNSFSIGAGESVKFVQPGANSVALNRVVGGDPSNIAGSLSANGKVFLVNPNGILFGAGASVNVGGLVASTLDIKDKDFLDGNYKFTANGGSGQVLNQGTINAPGGFVALLGANVSNDGVINARMGSVALAAGNAITLDVVGDGLLNVTVDQGAVNALVRNGGLIKADGGSVLMTAQAAGDLLKTAVNNTGVIEAQTIENRNGTIRLLGDMQSGTVNVAGTLDASAPTWGNGGFIETSAATVRVAESTKVTTAAAKGATGGWLIDPTDYTIAASGGDQTGAFYSTVLASTNVTIQSVSGGSGTAGNINVNDQINWSANTLTLTAQNNININQPLRGSGTAKLALEYGQQGVASSNTSTYNVKAEVDLPAGNNFSTKLGSDGVATTFTVINSLGAATSTNGTDLQGLKNALSGNFVLGANIDATGTANTAVWGATGFTPIGTSAVPFTGQFDGLGHVITGLNSSTATAGASVGLFGSNTGSIRNIGMVAPVIAANISGAQGNAAALAAINSGTMNNAYVSGGSVTVTIGAIGAGLVALNSGTISDSYNSSTVSVTGNYDFWMGGLVGNTTKTSSISNSYNTGEVVGAYTAGGLVGNNLGKISDSFNSGNVTGTTSTGGLAVYNRATGIITNSFNTGAVAGNSLTGGLVGNNMASGQIINSYSTGAVTGRTTTASGIGGLAGGNSGIISNSYATGNVAGATIVGGVVGSNTSGGSISNVYSSGGVSLLSGATGDIGGVIGRIASGTSPVISGGYYNSTFNPSLPGIGSNLGLSIPTSIAGLGSTQMQTGSNFSTFTFTTTSGAPGNNWVMVDLDGTLNNAGGMLSATAPMLASEYSTKISSAHQLQLMAMNLAGNYTLKQDINAAGTGTSNDVWNGATFVPVGASTSTPFTGSFDGAGHVVSNLVINRPSNNYAGLFGATSGTAIVRNVGLEGGSITGANNTGALVGLNLGRVDGSYSTVSVTGGNQVGGLVGSNGTSGGTPGIVSNSYASGAVNGTSIIGGLVGSNSGTLTNNYASGTVTGGNTQGGLTGTSNGTASGNFWDTTTSGMATSGTGTGLSTAQMKALATFSGAGWDLSGAWIVYDGNSAPLLRSFMTPLQVNFASNVIKTYDGTSTWTKPAATYSNTLATLQGTLNYGAAGSAVNAGTYAITAGGLYSGQRGYAITSNLATLTISQLAATLTGASVATRVYDGTTVAALTGGTISGLLPQDAGSVSFVTGTFASKNVGTGISVTPVGTGSAGANYLISAGVLSGDITPKALTVSGVVATSREYDGTTAGALTGGTLSGLVTGETLTVGPSTGVYADKNAGTNKAIAVTIGTLINGTGLASNYTVSNPVGVTGTITPKALTVTGATAGTRVYDGTTAASVTGGNLNGMVGGETLALTGMTGAYANKAAGTGKPVTINGATLADGTGLASNYLVTYPTIVTGDITKATIAGVTGLTATSRAYDGGTTAAIGGASAAFTGMVAGDNLSFSSATGAFGDKNAGTGKTVNVTGITLAGSDLANYNFTNNTATTSGTITPKALTITGATASNRVYDGSTTAAVTGGALSGLVGSEAVTLNSLSGAFADKNVGASKVVLVSGATMADGSNGGLASNYTVSSPVGLTANITKANISAVSGITASDKVYDGGTTATLNPTGATFTGMVVGDNLSLSATTATFADKNVGNAKAVDANGLALGGVDAGNYTLGVTTGTGTGNITPKALTITGMTVANRSYDGTTNASLSGGSIVGQVGSETVGVTGLTASFADKNAGNAKVVTTAGAILANGTNGGLATNYTVSNPVGITGNIVPKALTVTGMTVGSRAYDGTTAASLSGGVLNGLISGEALVVGSGTGLFSDKDVGIGKAVTASSVVLGNGTGGLASNYSVVNPSGLTGTITAKALTLTGITANNRVYDGTVDATISGGSLSGLVGTETLGFGTLVGAFVDKNAGIGKTVNVSGANLVSAGAGATAGLASNYTLGAPSSVTANITQATIATVAGITAGNKVYDGGTTATLNTAGATFNGKVAGDVLTVAAASGSFSNKNAALGKTVNISGIGLGGTDAGNYVLANNTATAMADITAAALTIKADDATRVAGQANPAFTASYTGLVGGDTAGSLTGALAFATPATIASPVGTYAISASGQSSTNYTVSYVDGALAVSAVPVAPVNPPAPPVVTPTPPVVTPTPPVVTPTPPVVTPTPPVVTPTPPVVTLPPVVTPTTPGTTPTAPVVTPNFPGTIGTQPTLGVASGPREAAVAAAIDALGLIAKGGGVQEGGSGASVSGGTGSSPTGKTPSFVANVNTPNRTIEGLNLTVQNFGIALPDEENRAR